MSILILANQFSYNKRTSLWYYGSGFPTGSKWNSVIGAHFARERRCLICSMNNATPNFNRTRPSGGVATNKALTNQSLETYLVVSAALAFKKTDDCPLNPLNGGALVAVSNNTALAGSAETIPRSLVLLKEIMPSAVMAGAGFLGTQDSPSLMMAMLIYGSLVYYLYKPGLKKIYMKIYYKRFASPWHVTRAVNERYFLINSTHNRLQQYDKYLNTQEFELFCLDGCFKLCDYKNQTVEMKLDNLKNFTEEYPSAAAQGVIVSAEVELRKAQVRLKGYMVDYHYNPQWAFVHLDDPDRRAGLIDFYAKTGGKRSQLIHRYADALPIFKELKAQANDLVMSFKPLVDGGALVTENTREFWTEPATSLAAVDVHAQLPLKIELLTVVSTDAFKQRVVQLDQKFRDFQMIIAPDLNLLTDLTNLGQTFNALDEYVTEGLANYTAQHVAEFGETVPELAYLEQMESEEAQVATTLPVVAKKANPTALTAVKPAPQLRPLATFGYPFFKAMRLEVSFWCYRHRRVLAILFLSSAVVVAVAALFYAEELGNLCCEVGLKAYCDNTSLDSTTINDLKALAQNPKAPISLNPTTKTLMMELVNNQRSPAEVGFSLDEVKELRKYCLHHPSTGFTDFKTTSVLQVRKMTQLRGAASLDNLYIEFGPNAYLTVCGVGGASVLVGTIQKARNSPFFAKILEDALKSPFKRSVVLNEHSFSNPLQLQAAKALKMNPSLYMATEPFLVNKKATVSDSLIFEPQTFLDMRNNNKMKDRKSTLMFMKQYVADLGKKTKDKSITDLSLYTAATQVRNALQLAADAGNEADHTYLTLTYNSKKGSVASLISVTPDSPLLKAGVNERDLYLNVLVNTASKKDLMGTVVTVAGFHRQCNTQWGQDYLKTEKPMGVMGVIEHKKLAASYFFSPTVKKLMRKHRMVKDFKHPDVKSAIFGQVHHTFEYDIDKADLFSPKAIVVKAGNAPTGSSW